MLSSLNIPCAHRKNFFKVENLIFFLFFVKKKFVEEKKRVRHVNLLSISKVITIDYGSNKTKK